MAWHKNDGMLFDFYVLKIFLKKFKFFLFFICLKLIFLNYFDLLMLKIIFKKINIILIYYRMKNILKSNNYYTSE
jgi:hypothetical protein